jgi:hypothetical protein
MFPMSTKLTKSFGIFFLTSSNVLFKLVSKSSGVNVGTSPEHLTVIKYLIMFDHAHHRHTLSLY